VVCRHALLLLEMNASIWLTEMWEPLGAFAPALHYTVALPPGVNVLGVVSALCTVVVGAYCAAWLAHSARKHSRGLGVGRDPSCGRGDIPDASASVSGAVHPGRSARFLSTASRTASSTSCATTGEATSRAAGNFSSSTKPTETSELSLSCCSDGSSESVVSLCASGEGAAVSLSNTPLAPAAPTVDSSSPVSMDRIDECRITYPKSIPATLDKVCKVPSDPRRLSLPRLSSHQRQTSCRSDVESVSAVIPRLLVQRSLTQMSTLSPDEDTDEFNVGMGGACCGLQSLLPFCSSWRSQPFKQTLVLLRHSERCDYVDPRYKETQDGQEWPHDTPITTNGVVLAKDVAKELNRLHKQVRFAAIICSPYRRCLETAAVLARRLKIPTMIDQEMGEVWGKDMRGDPPPWRTDIDLQNLVDSLKLTVLNERLKSGGIKCYGKLPDHPETLEAAKARYTVRIEEYIEQSAETKQNFILVTHADAIAASLTMFERGSADIRDMDFCARVIAQRDVNAPKDESPKRQAPQVAASCYTSHWKVAWSALSLQKMDDCGMEKFFEKMHLDNCKDHAKKSTERQRLRTKTDSMLDIRIKSLPIAFSSGVKEGAF